MVSGASSGKATAAAVTLAVQLRKDAPPKAISLMGGFERNRDLSPTIRAVTLKWAALTRGRRVRLVE
jgi:hypothetical protein